MHATRDSPASFGPGHDEFPHLLDACAFEVGGPLMETFAAARGASLTWRRRSVWNMDADLMAGERPIATLVTTGPWMSPRRGVTASGAWRIRYEGLFARDLVVRDEAGDAIVARYRPGWWGQGTVTFGRDRTFIWRRADFWGRRHEWVDSGGLVCVAFARRPGLGRQVTDVTVGAHVWDDAALEPLVLLGYDLLLRLSHHSAAFA
jgi:hypothetical protein